MAKKLPPMHPGEVLREEFMAPMNLSAGSIARAIGVPRTRIERIAEEKSGITADTALRLAKYFGNSAAFWLNLQNDFDVEVTERSIQRELKKIDPREDAAA